MEKLVFIMILGAMPLVLHNCESAKATPTFSKGKEAVQSDIVIIGVYKIETRSDVHLVELRIETNHNNIDVGRFTQAQEGIDSMRWQVPWDEKYLNEEGTKVIGDWMEAPTDSMNFTRLAFFLHFINFDNPLLTQYGKIDIPHPEKMPNRLFSIIKYERPD